MIGTAGLGTVYTTLLKSIRCLIIFKTTILLLRLLKSASPRCKRRLEEKEEEEEERSTGGVFMEPVPLRAVATNTPDDDDKTTHTHTHIDESGLGLRRCISTQVGLHGEPRLTLPTLPTTNSISTPRSSESVDDGLVQYWAAPPTRLETLIHSSPPTPSDRGGGKLGSWPGASTTKGPPQNSKRILPKET